MKTGCSLWVTGFLLQASIGHAGGIGDGGGDIAPPGGGGQHAPPARYTTSGHFDTNGVLADVYAGIRLAHVSFRPSTLVEALESLRGAVRADERYVAEIDMRAWYGENTSPMAPPREACPLVTLDGHDMSLGEVVRAVCDQSGLVSRSTPRGFCLWPDPGAPPLVRRGYTVKSDVVPAMEDGWRESLARAGVAWPYGAVARYLAGAGLLEIEQTARNHEHVLDALRRMGALARQVDVSMSVLLVPSETAPRDLSAVGELSVGSLLDLVSREQAEVVWAVRTRLLEGAGADVDIRPPAPRQGTVSFTNGTCLVVQRPPPRATHVTPRVLGAGDVVELQISRTGQAGTSDDVRGVLDTLGSRLLIPQGVPVVVAAVTSSQTGGAVYVVVEAGVKEIAPVTAGEARGGQNHDPAR